MSDREREREKEFSILFDWFCHCRLVDGSEMLSEIRILCKLRIFREKGHRDY